MPDAPIPAEVYDRLSPLAQHFAFAHLELGCSSVEAGHMAFFAGDQPLTEDQREYVRAHWDDEAALDA